MVSHKDAHFEELIKAHYEEALRFGIALTNSRELAEEFIQEAISRLYEQKDRYPLKEHFVRYLFKLMGRISIDEHRQVDRKKVYQQREKLSSASNARNDPAQKVEDDERISLIHAAIARLPKRERACFLMTVCEGLSYEEVACALSLSRYDVNNAISRARKYLRRVLAPIASDPQNLMGSASSEVSI